jgi:fructose-1,6-bisphosphatase/inositol monophosphatase family enzyme
MSVKKDFMGAPIDPDKVAEIIRTAAKKCIIPRYRALQSHEINTKSGPDDLVTIADKECEIELDKQLTALYPGSTVIGEESIAAGTKSIDELQKTKGIVWVTDPVDGTHNFVNGKTEFAVMLACVIDGETKYGWIYDVLNDKMLTAVKGQGVTFGSDRLSVAAPVAMKDASGFGAPKYFNRKVRPLVEDFKRHVKDMHTLRCAGHEYIRLASGKADFAVYGKIRQWDHLAGVLAVQEAGGKVMKWDGTPYKPSDNTGGLLIASGEALSREIQDTLIRPMIHELKNNP